MEQLSLADLVVRRILTCLRGSVQKSLLEITVLFNQKYPPLIRHGVLGRKKRTEEVAQVLQFLCTEGLVVREVLPVMNEVSYMTAQFYSLTKKGNKYFWTKH